MFLHYQIMALSFPNYFPLYYVWMYDAVYTNKVWWFICDERSWDIEKLRKKKQEMLVCYVMQDT